MLARISMKKFVDGSAEATDDDDESEKDGGEKCEIGMERRFWNTVP